MPPFVCERRAVDGGESLRVLRVVISWTVYLSCDLCISACIRCVYVYERCASAVVRWELSTYSSSVHPMRRCAGAARISLKDGLSVLRARGRRSTRPEGAPGDKAGE